MLCQMDVCAISVGAERSSMAAAYASFGTKPLHTLPAWKPKIAGAGNNRVLPNRTSRGIADTTRVNHTQLQGSTIDFDLFLERQVAKPTLPRGVATRRLHHGPGRRVPRPPRYEVRAPAVFGCANRDGVVCRLL